VSAIREALVSSGIRFHYDFREAPIWLKRRVHTPSDLIRLLIMLRSDNAINDDDTLVPGKVVCGSKSALPRLEF
jgi:hypothetical protein